MSPVGLGVGLVVDPRDLLVARGHDPHLPRRRTRRILDQVLGGDAAPRRARRAASRRRRPGRPGRRGCGVAPSARMLCATFAAPPRRYSSRSMLDDRDRRLRRDAVDVADDELVEHDVADDDDRLAGEAFDERVAAARRATERRRRVRSVERIGRSSAVRSAAYGQRDEHQEQHQELGVPEVVFEQARRRASRRSRRGRAAASDGMAARGAGGGTDRATTKPMNRARSAAPAARARRRSASARCAGAGSPCSTAHGSRYSA